MPQGKGTYGSQVGRPPKKKKYAKGGKSKENFKPHMMYGDGKSKMANTYEEHISLQKKGWGHSKKAKKGEKYALGGQIGKKTDWSNIVHGEYIMPYNQEYMDREEGGKINGPSHEEGGVDIEVEGGEIVINKNKNNAAGKHEKDLLNLNNNPDDYMIVKKKDNNYNWPSNDARKRGK